MGFLCYLSEYLIPVLIFYILADGIFSGTSVYDEFVKGASEGVRTVFRIFPTLVGLMTAVGMLRASGVLDVLTKLLVVPARILHFPRAADSAGSGQALLGFCRHVSLCWMFINSTGPILIPECWHPL